MIIDQVYVLCTGFWYGIREGTQNLFYRTPLLLISRIFVFAGKTHTHTHTNAY